MHMHMHMSSIAPSSTATGSHMCVWEGKVVGAHIFGAHTHPLAMPPKKGKAGGKKGKQASPKKKIPSGKDEVDSPKDKRKKNSRLSPRYEGMVNRTHGNSALSARRANARL